MHKFLSAFFTVTFFIATLLFVPDTQAKPDASIKYSVIREENPREHKETLILPYAFPSESMGTTIGAGGLVKGYLQDQLLFGGTVYGSFDDAKGIIGGMWDYRLPWTKRLFITAYGSYAYYPRQRAYAEVPRRPSESSPPPAGTNDSDKDNYIEDGGHDNWLELKLEYVLPMGNMKNRGMAEYHLKNGILQSGATGGKVWNPLKSGVSVLLFGQSSRYQSYQTDLATYSGDTFPFQLGYLYNNTDFPSNPSYGSSQYIAYSKDFSNAVTGSWSFVEFEASKYFDFGPTDNSRQRVLALNFWTGTSPSWDETVDSAGDSVIVNKPPFFEGARLGGLYRMRGYPNNRFNDRSVIYTAAEYRYTLRWNPIADTSWLRWLKADWFQLVGFVEGGRVAGEYSMAELFSDWKVDGGIGIRAMMAGTIVRVDMAGSDEGATAWVMFAQPF
ncbi:MAG: BamA/TamA family outer membrane protein [Deltaproteobacteria bacterium]|nr:BamA/TamA family outer membrane protein [Deltaproteobacteria bacterium]